MSSREEVVKSLDDLHNIIHVHNDRRSRFMIHFAVTRKDLQKFNIIYKHHFIVCGHTWSQENGFQIIHYASCTKKRGKGKVLQESKKNFSEDITAGLWIYTNDAYPQTDEQFVVAYDRFRSRENETKFSLRFNNCEHLVNFILTGNAVSKQVNEATRLEYFLMTIIDHKGIIAATAVLVAMCALVVYTQSPAILHLFDFLWHKMGDLPISQITELARGCIGPHDVLSMVCDSIDRNVLSMVREAIDQGLLSNLRPEVFALVLPSLLMYRRNSLG